MRACFPPMDDRFMPERTKNIRLLRLIGVLLATGLAGGAGVHESAAQDETPAKSIDSVVSIADTGGDVKALGARVNVDGDNARVKAAGAIVDIRGEVQGHVWAAGADVAIVAQTDGPVRALGAKVAVRGRIDGDISAAGAVVQVDAATSGNVRAAGASVRIGPLASIDGRLSAAGASVGFDGQVAGDARFAGAVVTLNGLVGGNVTVHAERLVIGPQAVISGNLLVRSLSEPDIDEAATISGEIVRETPGKWFDKLPELSIPVIAGAFALSIFLSGLILLIFARATFGEAVDHVRFRPLSSVLYGVIALLIVAVVVALLMSSVIGIALGTALLLLVPIVLVLAQPVAAAGIMGWIFGRGVPRLGVIRLLLLLVFGSLVIGFVGIIPITGLWIVVAAFIFGIGGFLRALLWRFRTMRTSDQRFGSRTAEVGT